MTKGIDCSQLLILNASFERIVFSDGPTQNKLSWQFTHRTQTSDVL